MTGNPRTADSFMEVVPVADIAASAKETLARHFSEAERHRFEGRPARTIAGQVALKIAVCRLARTRLGADLRTPEVAISRTSVGAPVISGVENDDRRVREALLRRVLVSISHSRKSAVGLAVLADGNPDRSDTGRRP